MILSALPLLLLQLLPFSAAQTASVNGGYWFPGSGILPNDINSNLFTHLFCAFAGIDNQTNQVYVSSSDDATFAQFTKTVQLRNPSVKTLLSIGGDNVDMTVFSAMAAASASRKSFIDSSIKLARAYGFSGLDLNWDHPNTPADMANLGALLTEWRQAVAAEARSSGKDALLLTAALFYISRWDELNYPAQNNSNYPAQAINSALDWVNLVAYSMYAPYRSEKLTNSHAMLYNPADPSISGSKGIRVWILDGVDAKKLVLGIPFYGYAWLLADANKHDLLAPATGPAGPDGGMMFYNQIRSFISKNQASVVYNSTLVTNYCYSGTTWIGYDDVEAIAAKVSYAKKTAGLLGYFAWHVGADNNWALSLTAKQLWDAVDPVESTKDLIVEMMCPSYYYLN